MDYYMDTIYNANLDDDNEEHTYFILFHVHLNSLQNFVVLI